MRTTKDEQASARRVYRTLYGEGKIDYNSQQWRDALKASSNIVENLSKFEDKNRLKIKNRDNDPFFQKLLGELNKKSNQKISANIETLNILWPMFETFYLYTLKLVDWVVDSTDALEAIDEDSSINDPGLIRFLHEMIDLTQYGDFDDILLECGIISSINNVVQI